MSFKEFGNAEIDILIKQITKAVEDIQCSDEDPDVIGTEVEYSDRMLKSLSVIHDILELIDKSGIDTKANASYITGVLNDIFNGIPLSDLASYENNPEEWTEWENVQMNSRYPQLVRRIIKVGTEPIPVYFDNTEAYKAIPTKPVYSDITRFQVYDLIKNQKTKLPKIFDGFHMSDILKFVPEIQIILDQLIPIEFPYNVKNDRIKLYVEAFECSLQPEMPPVKTLALTHYMSTVDDKPNRIMKFFDISEGGINEIDIKAYLPRRQIFEKSVEVHTETDSEVPGDGNTD